MVNKISDQNNLELLEGITLEEKAKILGEIKRLERNMEELLRKISILEGENNGN